MNALLLDTHAWVWSMFDERKLAPRAAAALRGAAAVYVSAVSFFEIAQKVRVGKWPEMASQLDRLPEFLQRQGGLLSPVDENIAILAGRMNWIRHDPFDRIVAATAVELGCPLISTDGEFDSLDGFDGWEGRIWR